MTAAKPFLIALLCSLGASSIASAQEQSDEETASGEGMWVGAIDDANEQSNRVPGGVEKAPSGDGTYRVQSGDTLWDISSRQMGNAYEWPRLWSYNPEITNPHWIYPDTELKLGTGGTGPAPMAAPTSRGAALRHSSLNAGDIYLADEAFVDEQAIKDSGYIIGAHEEGMLLSPSDWCYVRFPGKPPVAIGSELTVFRWLDEHDELETQKAHVVRIQGILKLMDYDAKRKLGRALVVEALDPIERGFRVSSVPRRFTVTSPRPATKTIQAEIVASVRPRVLLANNQLVFINKGAKDGVENGVRFFVVRKGDIWRENLNGREEWSGAIVPDVEGAEDADYPEEIVAEGRIVDVRKKTSTMLITRAVFDCQFGDRVRTIPGR